MSAPRLPGLFAVMDVAATLEVVGTIAAFALAIGAGVAVLVWARNWRRQQNEESATMEPIETYQQMLEAGTIDQHEFDRIQARLSQPPNLEPEPAPPDSPADRTP
jgi:hypothetical protein